ncbi:predicted protein, partial [Nematostella vectensis]
GCNTNIDLVFAIDASSSVGKVNFERVKGFIRRLVESFHISRTSTRVAAIVYSSRPRVAFDFNRYTSARRAAHAVKRLRFLRGGTSTGRALRLASSRLFRRYGRKRRKVLMLITDGKSSDDVLKPSKALKRKGVQIFAVGVGMSVSRNELILIASHPSQVYQASFTSLSAIVKSLARKTCESK